jgi:hypothetical protein
MHVALHFLWHLSLCLCTSAKEHASTNLATSEAPPTFNEAFDNGSQGYYPTRIYITEEDLDSPQTNFLQWDSECIDDAYYFITPRGWGISNPGPMLLDERGNLIWAKHFGNDFGGQAYDFKVQSYRGEQFLTFWLGDDRVRGHGSGSYYMVGSYVYGRSNTVWLTSFAVECIL